MKSISLRKLNLGYFTLIFRDLMCNVNNWKTNRDIFSVSLIFNRLNFHEYNQMYISISESTTFKKITTLLLPKRLFQRTLKTAKFCQV